MASKRPKTTAKGPCGGGGTHRSRGRWTLLSPGQLGRNLKRNLAHKRAMAAQRRVGGAS